ncbi:MAG TPA: hypothetical protein VMW10_10220 [Alphaproteobacteria bacterium]|nr:hypothetical protein [Alphaproteobacteria bacterium]
MKKIIRLMSVGLITFVLFASGEVKSAGISSQTCPSGYCPCVNGTCGAPCNNTEPCESCNTCAQRVSAFIGATETIYTLPEGTLFLCASPNEMLNKLKPPTHIQGKDFDYHACQTAPVEAPLKESFKTSLFTSEPGTIYSFSESTSFICESNRPPKKITASKEVRELPSVYWVCPTAAEKP